MLVLTLIIDVYVQYINKCACLRAPALQAAALPVFMFWLLPYFWCFLYCIVWIITLVSCRKFLIGYMSREFW